METNRKPRRVASRVGLALFFALLLMVVLLNLVYLVNVNYLLESGLAQLLVNDLVLYGISVPVLLLILRTVPDGPVTPRTPWRMTLGRFLLLMVFCFGASYGANLLSLGLDYAFTPVREAVQELLGYEGGGEAGITSLLEIPVLWRVLLGACVPAIGEEFIFRYALRRTLNGAGDKIFIFVSGFTFGLFHMNLAQFLYAGIMGMVFAWVYAVTRKIIYPMLMHLLFNLTGVVLVPSLDVENALLIMLVGLAVILLIIAAIAIFVSAWRSAVKECLPPSEPGWPYKPTKTHLPRVVRKQQAAYAAYYRIPLPDAGPVYQTEPDRPRCGGVALCLLNPGMILYILLALILIAVNLLLV